MPLPMRRDAGDRVRCLPRSGHSEVRAVDNKAAVSPTFMEPYEAEEPHRPAKMPDVALSFLVGRSMVVVDGDVVIQSA